MAPYLLGIAVNVAADWSRANRRTAHHPIEGDETWPGLSVTYPELLCDFANQLEALPLAESPLVLQIWMHRILASESERAVSTRLGISRRRLRSIEKKLRRDLL
jgi:DNA-directed RNA polymerase specialized sigma24 family protein